MKIITLVFGTCILFLNSSYGQYYLKDDFTFIHDSDRTPQQYFTNYIDINSLNFDFKREFDASQEGFPIRGQLELVLSAKNSGPYIHEQLQKGTLTTKFEIAIPEVTALGTNIPLLFYQFENVRITSYSDNYSNDGRFIRITVVYDKYVYFYKSKDGTITKTIGWDFVNQRDYP